MLPALLPRLKPGARLIEPFLGSGAVFLNTDYQRYLLADANPDLIDLYRQLAQEGERFIRYCRSFFTARHDCRAGFYALRDAFNHSRDKRRKAALFLYLNRHGYNGLCRYNRRGRFNTPFGRYRKPYFPLREMRQFLQRAGRAEFRRGDFAATMEAAGRDDVIYCDPPYVPLSATASFTSYHSESFDWQQQERLAAAARRLADQGAQVLISNHDLREVRALYRRAGAKLHRFTARRSISADGGARGPVGELLAVF